MDLYSHIPPLGKNIPISVQLFPVDNSVPTEEEIDWAETQLRNHCYVGPTGMREEHLKRWLVKKRKSEKNVTTITTRAGTKENRGTTAVHPAKEPMEAENWEMVVELVHSAFWEGNLVEEAMWRAMFLIPNEEEGLPWYWPRGGDVEGSGGDFKSPAHGLHHLPRFPPWVLVRLRDRYR